MTDERRVLVLANQTLCGDRLVEVVTERVAAGPHAFHVVVPATPVREQEGPPGTGDDDVLTAPVRAYALAQQRLDRAVEQIRAAGASASGEVGDADPLVAAELALEHFPADEVLVLTLPQRFSRWLRGGLPSRVGRASGLPVQHVVEEAVIG
ncbi:hypothetical protein SAMN06893096_10362 [Geodermatophilus pulveris]|uniref:Universal stress protein family protein n=1 Tax=Geodermatophilus pulveris TaxID=1564159 RepID=A0A239DA77_9ACTN|nr:hypothetical protein [Geodermatophilus pulveris]SNS28563.1 hypothetical protein SAMN06893096_10362 [Geodermatophilus pulveris]